MKTFTVEADMFKRYLMGVGLALLALLLMVQFIGCAKDQVPGVSQEELARRRAAQEAAARRAEAMRRIQLLRERFYNEDALFDYDRSFIRPDARTVLQAKAEYMKSHPGVRVVIQGNCDERGSRSYNLALGDRRAKSAKRYLIQMGISADRMRTVSFGKDRPLCTEHNETCWQKNRRAHFIDQ
jgi:peptidoglycan-associated lipoprotein